MFKNLSSLFGGKKNTAPKPTPVTRSAPEPPRRTESRVEIPAPFETYVPNVEFAPIPEPSPIPEREPTPRPVPVKRRIERPEPPSSPIIAPETLCGITAEMNHQEIYTRLATLYRRYNRATSSLNAPLRSEAEQMLNAIVAVREKIWGTV